MELAPGTRTWRPSTQSIPRKSWKGVYFERALDEDAFIGFGNEMLPDRSRGNFMQR
ncbi:MAG: hypothetical protein ACREXX_11910 [Gammaproteobacteria bacterium]